jgi:hypothetical protein
MLKVIRLLRGPLLASFAAAVIFFLPDQVRELYRITAADRDWLDMIGAVAVFAAMFWTFWWVAFEIGQRFDGQIDRASGPARSALATLPVTIAAFPLIACSAGLWAAQALSEYNATDTTSPWAGETEKLQQAIGGLKSYAIGLVLLAAMLALVAYGLQRNLRIKLEARGLRQGVFSAFGLGMSLAIAIGMIAAVVISPTFVPRALGTVPLLALFFIVLVLMLGQMTFWHERTGVPFLSVLLIAALVFGAFDWNDNHGIATVRKEWAASPTIKSQLPSDTWDSFQAWYRARPSKAQFKNTFPVYVVAAQGGGIYAAYHTATLLARMQDYCPEFRNHLFAISSVSGGSLGAAVFAAVTKGFATLPREDSSRDSYNVPCPAMEPPTKGKFSDWKKYWQPDKKYNAHEQAASNVLASNFLAPLAAAALFPDFTQHFLPFSIPSLDRARWLEGAFEESWRHASIGGANPFEESVLKMWSPEGPAPALIINTTESDSGRRLVIAPFQVANEQVSNSEVLQFPLWNRNLISTPPGLPCHGQDISLSTAVSLSARFPWLTPAGSLYTDCTEDGVRRKSRLVDGGYFDNSGIATALDVISQIERGLSTTEHRIDGGPKIEIHLIVLNTSEFPKRDTYGLGDELEPIRTLLSTREARTPIAINQAYRQLGAVPITSSASESQASIRRVHEARFRNPIYTLPLGWRLSTASRDLIDMQSGRYWECDPDLNYQQQGQEFSNADCIEKLIYHQLNETLDEELKVLELDADWRRQHPPDSSQARLDHENFLRCYQFGVLSRHRSPLRRRQRDSIEEILRLWDANPQIRHKEWLGFMLAHITLSSTALPRRLAGCPSEKCVLRHLSHFPSMSGLLQPINGKYYYPRGFIALRGSQDYRRVADVTGIPVYDTPDLLLVPEVSARVLFAWMTDSRLSSLAKNTSQDGFDLEGALDAYIGKSKQPHDLNDVKRKAVKAANELFMRCIMRNARTE